MKRYLSVVIIGLLIICCGCKNAIQNQPGNSADQSNESVINEVSSDETFTKEKYIEVLKKSEVFKMYNADDWRSHAYDYKLIAFTFDDGPIVTEAGDNAVTAVADAFERFDGAGTFFFTGRSLDANGYSVPKYVVSKGHEIANHSYSHLDLNTVKDSIVSVEEVEKVNRLYHDNMQYLCKFFRGGGYSSNSDVWNCLNSLNMPAIGSYKGFADYSNGDATSDSIVEWFQNEYIPDGAIIGMHSTKEDKTTATALEKVLPDLYEKGYRFCTLSELFMFKGVKFEDIPKDKYIIKCEISNDGTVVYR